MAIDKIQNTLQFAAGLDDETRALELTEQIIDFDANVVFEITEAESFNLLTSLDQDFSTSLDFQQNIFGTNERVNVEELIKIKDTSVYTTGITDDEKTSTLALTNEIYTAVTTGRVLADVDVLGFTGFSIISGDTDETGFANLIFTESSGFKVSRNEKNDIDIDIKHNSFGKVGVSGTLLNAVNSDIINFKGSGLNYSTEVSSAGQKFVVIDNQYISVESMDDVALTNPLQEEELLMQQGGKLKNFNSREIRPLTVYGGEF